MFRKKHSIEYRALISTPLFSISIWFEITSHMSHITKIRSLKLHQWYKESRIRHTERQITQITSRFDLLWEHPAFSTLQRHVVTMCWTQGRGSVSHGGLGLEHFQLGIGLFLLGVVPGWKDILYWYTWKITIDDFYSLWLLVVIVSTCVWISHCCALSQSCCGCMNGFCWLAALSCFPFFFPSIWASWAMVLESVYWGGMDDGHSCSVAANVSPMQDVWGRER